jgi:hypothetical protein
MSRTLALLATLALALAAGGCTIFRLQGPRPLNRSEIDERMPNLTKEQTEQWREEILADPLAKRDVHRLDTYGYQIFGRQGFPWPLLAGTFRQERHLSPEFGAGRRELIEQTDWNGFLSPLLYTDYRNGIFDVRSGRAVAVETKVGVTPLIGWGSSVKPDGRFLEIPAAAADARMTVDEIPYQEEWVVYLGAGILAFGEHNRAPFMQILWLQIPLGSGMD